MASSRHIDLRVPAHAPTEHSRLLGPLVRMNAISFAVVVGLLIGVGFCGATLWLLIRGGPSPGRTLATLGYVFPGYSVSWTGAFIGLFWGAVAGFLASLPWSWIYYGGVLRQIERAGPDQIASGRFNPEQIDVRYFAAASGVLAGLLILVTTEFLVLTHESGQPLGPNLGRLAEFLPGYSISVSGGFVGFVYFTVLGAGLSTCAAWIYNRLVSRTQPNDPGPRVLTCADSDDHSEAQH